ncbi:MAG TPA: S1/P1 nuclease [Pyrinomonadaceae bacterium]|jgi:hypothetical protein|nr:S1/P1 nuclease [Pyrinomonadaceae bacterium]
MKPSRRKSLVCFILLIFLLASLPPRAQAWGPSGHRIVALMAMRHLTPQARRKIDTLLEGDTLEDVANWADSVRDERPETAGWHFVNLPPTAARFSRPRDCRDADGGEPGCAVTAIEKYRDILSGTGGSAKRAEALKFIVHFVGDIHQPLHVSFKDDKGGNNIRLTFFGRSSNLHKVWDSGIIGRAGLSDEGFAAELEAVLRDQSGDEEFGEMDDATRRRIERMQAGTLDSWANESFALAKSNAYDSVARNNRARLGQAYYDANWQVVDDQLTRAGLRLAKILNDALR